MQPYPMCTASCFIVSSWRDIMADSADLQLHLTKKYLLDCVIVCRYIGLNVNAKTIYIEHLLIWRFCWSQLVYISIQMYHGELRGFTQVSYQLMPRQRDYRLYFAHLRHHSECLPREHIQLYAQAAWCLRIFPC